jgi:hypothetical protein
MTKTGYAARWLGTARLEGCYSRRVLLTDGPLTLREFMTHEPVPLAAIFGEVLARLATSPEAVVFGAHAVNAYCETERMTVDIDVLSTDAADPIAPSKGFR